jgi:hypothetical protein
MQMKLLLFLELPIQTRQKLISRLCWTINLTLSEAVAILGGKYSDSITAFDKGHQQAMVMSDSQME